MSDLLHSEAGYFNHIRFVSRTNEVELIKRTGVDLLLRASFKDDSPDSQHQCAVAVEEIEDLPINELPFGEGDGIPSRESFFNPTMNHSARNLGKPLTPKVATHNLRRQAVANSVVKFSPSIIIEIK